MVDIFTPSKRSEIMSRIKGGNTKPERAVRSMLHNMGYRFRLNRKDLPGKPDIVLPRYNTVIFVHGCFWHRHAGCKYAYFPKSRAEFWHKKFESNIVRDRGVTIALENLGWQVIVVWECELRNPEKLAVQLDNSLKHLPLPKGSECTGGDPGSY